MNLQVDGNRLSTSTVSQFKFVLTRVFSSQVLDFQNGTFISGFNESVVVRFKNTLSQFPVNRWNWLTDDISTEFDVITSSGDDSILDVSVQIKFWCDVAVDTTDWASVIRWIRD